MAIVWENHLGHLYTRNQAEGALLNGTRIEKANSQRGDGHQDGAVGTVIGSLPGPVETPDVTDRYAYFVVWDDDPGAGLPIGIGAERVKVWEGG